MSSNKKDADRKETVVDDDGSIPCWSDGSPIVIVHHGEPKIDPATGEQEIDDEGRPVETKEIDIVGTFFANPFPAKKLLDVAEDVLKKMSAKIAKEKP